MEKIKKKWIAIDGVDATGKSEQVLLLAKYLKEKGLNTVALSEFSAGPVGHLINKIVLEQRFYTLNTNNQSPWADAVALFADILYRSEVEVQPALENGDTIISDRGLLSFFAYQGIRIQTRNKIQNAVNQLVNCSSPFIHKIKSPDIHIHLRVEEKEMQNRLKKRGDKVLPEDMLTQMRQFDEAMIELSKSLKVVTIDTTSMTPPEVTEDIIKKLLSTL